MTILRNALTATFVAVLLAAAPTAHAQDVESETPELSTMPAHMEAQVVALLQADRPSARERAMQLIIHYKTRQNVVARFEDAIPHLVDLYVHGATDEERLMSLSTLYALHDENGMRQLASVLDHAPSARARRVARLTLKQYQSDREQTASLTHPSTTDDASASEMTQ